MNHPLDNPVWNALISGNSHLANGSAQVKFFDGQVSPFAALNESNAEHLLELYDTYPSEGPVFLWAAEQLTVPPKWNVVHCIPGLQMVYQHATVPDYETEGLVPLTEEHVPEMVALTKLTKPGPFDIRTIAFGNYEGIFEDGQLVAMTGQRFHCHDHVEISAVCTHPGYLGRGYAKRLLASQLKQITGRSFHPYLHVREDNERAIHVYQTLGFLIRMRVFFYVIRK